VLQKPSEMYISREVGSGRGRGTRRARSVDDVDHLEFVVNTHDTRGYNLPDKVLILITLDLRRIRDSYQIQTRMILFGL
jgi:hypothetical protein